MSWWTRFLSWFGLATIAKPIKIHRASFLFDNAHTRVMNGLAHTISDAAFDAYLQRCKDNGDTCIYLYVGYNKGDGPGITSIYADDVFGGTIDEGKVKMMQKRMKRCLERGLQIVGWLFPDDNSRNIPFKDMDALKAYCRAVVINFDDYISEYVMGIEVDEYLAAGQVDVLATYVGKITEKDIGCHQKPGRFDFAKLGSVNKHYHQYGFGRTAGYIESETARIIAVLGKPVIAAEYHASSDTPQAKALGQAAVRGGAKGTGNGR